MIPGCDAEGALGGRCRLTWPLRSTFTRCDRRRTADSAGTGRDSLASYGEAHSRRGDYERGGGGRSLESRVPSRFTHSRQFTPEGAVVAGNVTRPVTASRGLWLLRMKNASRLIRNLRQVHLKNLVICRMSVCGFIDSVVSQCFKRIYLFGPPCGNPTRKKAHPNEQQSHDDQRCRIAGLHLIQEGFQGLG